MAPQSFMPALATPAHFSQFSGASGTAWATVARVEPSARASRPAARERGAAAVFFIGEVLGDGFAGGRGAAAAAVSIDRPRRREFAARTGRCARIRAAMARYARNELRSGLKVLLDGAPHEILSAESEKPGKGQVFTRTRPAQTC